MCNLINIVSARERSEKLIGFHSHSNYKLSKLLTPYPLECEDELSTAQALVRNENVSYIFCDGEYWSDQCSNYQTAEDRKIKIKGIRVFYA